MTPKEKAKELVDKFSKYADDTMQDLETQACKCALIAVDEIISALVGLRSLEHWQEVKTEIERL